MPIIRRKKTIEELTAELDEMQTAMEAMWNVVKAKTGATETDLDESVAQLASSIKTRLKSKEERTPRVVVERPFSKKEESVEVQEPVMDGQPEVEELVAEEVEVEVVTKDPVDEDPVDEEPVVAEEVVTEDPVVEEVAKELVADEIVEEPQGVSPDAINVKLRGDRVKCPTCSKVFSVRDIRFWDGEKCLACKTHLIIEGIEDLVF